MDNWFHVSGGVFFKRNDSGDVLIGTGTSFEDVEVTYVFDASSWASIVSSVSHRGEDHETFNEALKFHMGSKANGE